MAKLKIYKPKNKKKHYGTVKITEAIHNKFANTLANFRSGYPFVYLLGKNSKDVITKAVHIKKDTYNTNCFNMIGIRANVLVRKSMKLFKEKLIPCGLARIGDFNLSGLGGSRGESMFEMRDMSKDAFILSYTRNGLKIETYIGKGKIKTYGYKIVPNGRR